jgi:hypothetical protein
MLNKLFEGFLFGAGFAVAAAIVWTIHTLLVLPAIMTAKFQDFPARSIEGEPTEVVPADAVATPDERKFELYKGERTRMEIPSGGGILSLAVIDAPKSHDRPSTIQAWITEREAFLVETTGETPAVKKMPYPKTGAADYADELVREYAGFREGNLTTTIDAAEVRRLRNGGASDHHHLNGVLRITKEGVVFFVPNKFET